MALDAQVEVLHDEQDADQLGDHLAGFGFEGGLVDVEEDVAMERTRRQQAQLQESMRQMEASMAGLREEKSRLESRLSNALSQVADTQESARGASMRRLEILMASVLEATDLRANSWAPRLARPLRAMARDCFKLTLASL